MSEQDEQDRKSTHPVKRYDVPQWPHRGLSEPQPTCERFAQKYRLVGPSAVPRTTVSVAVDYCPSINIERL
jgi:hypothetical protein